MRAYLLFLLFLAKDASFSVGITSVPQRELFVVGGLTQFLLELRRVCNVWGLSQVTLGAEGSGDGMK